MSGQTAPSAPSGVAHAQLILAAGFASAAAILAAWLLVWLIFFQTHLRLLAFSSESPDGTLPIHLAFQRADAREATAREQGAGDLRSLPATDPKALLSTVRAYLDERRGQTSVVVIAAPALGSFGAESSEVVLPPVATLRHLVRDEALRGSTLRDLVDLFKQARGQRLLILDIGRTRADADAGAFGDDAVAELVRLAQAPDPAHAAEWAAHQREWAGLAILCSNSPGQWTWASDADGRTVFGHFVAEGLRRGGDVATLLRNVPAQVYAWVASHRGGAVQTPLVLGDQALTFTLPSRRDRPSNDPDPRQGDPARSMRDWLLRHYRHHAAYERTGLPGLDPLAWREYRRTWLAAERLFRAGQINACQQMLAEADAREALFKAPGDRDWPSLELGTQVTTDPDRLKPLVAAREALLGALASEAPTAGDDTAEGQTRRFHRVFAEALRADGGRSDPRPAPLVEQAAQLRILAERASTAAPAGHPWIDLLIDRAAAKRREATDLLDSTAPAGPILGLIHEAEAGYSEALRVARAVVVAQQVAADLPFLGAWAVRSGQFNRDRDRWREVARRAQALASTLDTGRRDPGEPPVARVHAEADALAREFAPLRAAFDRAVNLAGQAANWRDLDDVLAVPTLSPDLREALVTRSIDPGLVVALRPPPPPEVRAGATESAVTGLVRQGISSGVTINDLGRQGLNVVSDQNRESDQIGPPPEVRPDPTFAQYQSDLANLEWCLLTAGGLTHKGDLEPLLHPPTAPSTISRAARKARARLLAQTPAPAPVGLGDELGSATLAAFERARVVLPAPDPDSSPGELGDVGGARWGRFLIRLADILREDGDARLASRYLDALPERDRDADAAQRVARGIAALIRPITLRVEAKGSTTLDGSAATPVTLAVQAPAGSPRGRAALLIGEPGKVRLHADAPTDLIAVGQPTPATRRLEVGRLEPLAEVAHQARLALTLVYRGRRVDAEAIPFDLPIVRSDFRVKFSTPAVPGHRHEMKQKYFVPESLVVDQFSRNDGNYTFYRGADTTLNAVVSYAPVSREQPATRRIQVAATFDGKALPVALIESRPANAPADKEPRSPSTTFEIRQGAGQDLTFRIGPIDTTNPQFRPRPEGSDFRFEVRDVADIPGAAAVGNDPAVAHRSEVRFREVDPAAYFAVAARRVSPTEVEVSVRRGEADPIATIVGVAVYVAGGAPTLESIVHERNGRLNKFNADHLMAGGRPENKAVLPHGERATFRFHVDPADKLLLRAEILNNNPRPPWPLVVNPDNLPPAVVAPLRGANPNGNGNPNGNANPAGVNPAPAAPVNGNANPGNPVNPAPPNL